MPLNQADTLIFSNCEHDEESVDRRTDSDVYAATALELAVLGYAAPQLVPGSWGCSPPTAPSSWQKKKRFTSYKTVTDKEFGPEQIKEFYIWF